MGWFLSFLPRPWLAEALTIQWRATLTRGERVRFDYWGATGNVEHHPYAWASKLPDGDSRDAQGEPA